MNKPRKRLKSIELAESVTGIEKDRLVEIFGTAAVRRGAGEGENPRARWNSAREENTSAEICGGVGDEKGA